MVNFLLQQKKKLSAVILLFFKNQLEAMCWKAYYRLDQSEARAFN